MKNQLLSLLIIITIFSSCDSKSSRSLSDTMANNNSSSNSKMNFEIVNIPKDIFEIEFDLSTSVSDIEFLALKLSKVEC